MQFTETPIAGAYLIDPELRADARGFFARTWCREEFEQQGLNSHWEQCATSFNHQSGTLRGLHFQLAPHAEDKLVRCTRGAIFDVLVDLRAGSATFGRWFGVELADDNHRQLYLPQGCAHGFLTLVDQTEVAYQLSAAHHPESSRGVRWDDPELAIRWPAEARVISERDRTLPLLAELHQLGACA